MRIYRLAAAGIFLSFGLVITACTRSAEVITPVFTSSVASSPLPVISVPTLEVPHPEPGKGNVHGVLVLNNFPLPLEITELYLGNIFTSDTGDFSVYYFNRDENPKGQWINVETGEFLFEDVLPGEYVLILWWDVQSYVPVYRAGTTSAVTVTVTSDSVTELGVIVSNQ